VSGETPRAKLDFPIPGRSQDCLLLAQPLKLGFRFFDLLAAFPDFTLMPVNNALKTLFDIRNALERGVHFGVPFRPSLCHHE
jgi:hypothetical protein